MRAYYAIVAFLKDSAIPARQQVNLKVIVKRISEDPNDLRRLDSTMKPLVGVIFLFQCTVHAITRPQETGHGLTRDPVIVLLMLDAEDCGHDHNSCESKQTKPHIDLLGFGLDRSES